MDMKLDFDQLYYISRGTLKGEFVVAPQNYEQIPYEELLQYYKGIYPNGRPEIFIQTGGGDKKPPKQVIPSSLRQDLYHKNIIDAFIKNGFTGWESYPVKIIKRNGDIILDYHTFIKKGICGKFDIHKSKVISYTEDYGYGPKTEKRYQGLYFDPATWDGSDIFAMDGTWIDIITEPVMQELIKLKVNLVFKRLSEYILLDKVE